MFSPTRQALLPPRAKRRERGRRSHNNKNIVKEPNLLVFLHVVVEEGGRRIAIHTTRRSHSDQGRILTTAHALTADLASAPHGMMV